MRTRDVRKIVVIGAGMAGLTAARRLRAAGREVTIVDKARGVGGRMATRRVGSAVCDHGAQYFTARDPKFLRFVDGFLSAGAATEWAGFANVPDPRYRGTTGMTAVPRHLARDLDVRLRERVLAAEPREKGWRVRTEAGTILEADAIVVTAPIPQGLAILDAGRVDLHSETRAALESVRYDSCFTAMAVLDGPSAVPAPGGLRLREGPIGFVADNRAKGISPDAVSVTVQASAEFSAKRLDREASDVAAELLELAREWIGEANVLETSAQRWRYSRPVRTALPPALVCETPAPLVFAGDAFGGPRVEGAALSGLAAAYRLTIEEQGG